tara:strand:+ start:22210 stop:23709 length:1500 start_codon:yes stop_codon:yes gene_type:complete
MGIKASLSKPFAKWVSNRNYKWASNPIKTQKEVFIHLLSKAKNTQFGKDHKFASIESYSDFKRLVPIRDYEELKPYMERVVAGEADVLWPDKPIYLSKTSGTTSGAKYIPLTKESIPNHINAARDAILHYIAETGKTDFVNGKMIFLQGSPELDHSGPIPVGRLSGIVAHHVPNYLQKNRMPSFEVNCIEDWETKVEAICRETIPENMSLISGIPPWVQMYFEKLIELSDKGQIKEVFPNFSLFIYGGVNYEPYRAVMEKLIGKSIDSIELYPASEGFIAFQDSQHEEGMLLLLNSGIFYEFIPSDEFFDENPRRIMLDEVELGVNYVIILNTNAGLWGYNIGDTIRFVSKSPYRIVVSGRLKHYTSAFGEHVIAEEVERAMSEACQKLAIQVEEFHLAPQVNPKEGLPYHEWFVEATLNNEEIKQLSKSLNEAMIKLNPYYKDLIHGKVLKELEVTQLPKGTFKAFMKSQGKLGGQNKLPRLANDRKLADSLLRNLTN